MWPITSVVVLLYPGESDGEWIGSLCSELSGILGAVCVYVSTVESSNTITFITRVFDDYVPHGM